MDYEDPRQRSIPGPPSDAEITIWAEQVRQLADEDDRPTLALWDHPLVSARIESAALALAKRDQSEPDVSHPSDEVLLDQGWRIVGMLEQETINPEADLGQAYTAGDVMSYRTVGDIHDLYAHFLGRQLFTIDEMVTVIIGEWMSSQQPGPANIEPLRVRIAEVQARLDGCRHIHGGDGKGKPESPGQTLSAHKAPIGNNKPLRGLADPSSRKTIQLTCFAFALFRINVVRSRHVDLL